MTEKYVIFSHGQGSGPWGGKITAMAGVARGLGFTVKSVDYQAIDHPNARVERLLEVGRELGQPAVLVGSSLGGHVATAASRGLKARGLFLIAPAFYMPGYEQYTPGPADCPVAIVHGWRDDIVSVDNSIRWAREHRAALHILDGDHRLQENIAQINALFAAFLRDLGG
jgi:pimeloyl-ACP methyl ester carboxylesterase